MPGTGSADENTYVPKGHIIDPQGNKFSSVGIHGMGALEEDGKAGFFRFVVIHAAGEMEFVYDYMKDDRYNPATARAAAERDRFIIEEEWASLAGLRK